jgi:predicted RNA methylase
MSESIDQDQFEVGEFIPLHYHFHMLNDANRMRGFETAIAHVVKAGTQVLELGGGTGVLSFFAARQGAHVRCVERNLELVTTARNILSLNGLAERVDVIHGDALRYLPPEPVDVVICEMLHTGMLREKQLPLIHSFKQRYLEKFGGPLPVFLPEALIQAIQPVQQDFDFQGYCAPIFQFQEPTIKHHRTIALAEPSVFQRLSYQDEFSPVCYSDAEILIETAGRLNAVRMLTKNVLAILLDEKRTIDWYTQHIIVPLPAPIQVNAGDRVAISFDYDAGAQLNALLDSLDVRECSAADDNASDSDWLAAA